MIATHYVFNIEYCAKVKDALYFIQEKVLGFSDKSSMYRNISALLTFICLNFVVLYGNFAT